MRTDRSMKLNRVHKQTCIYAAKFILTNVPMGFNGESLFNKLCWNNYICVCKHWTLSYTYHENWQTLMDSRQNIRAKILKLLFKKRKYLCDLQRPIFLREIAKALTLTGGKNGILDSIKVKISALQKTLLKSKKGKSQSRRNIQNFDKWQRLESKLYEKLLYIKKTSKPPKNCSKTWIDISQMRM